MIEPGPERLDQIRGRGFVIPRQIAEQTEIGGQALHLASLRRVEMQQREAEVRHSVDRILRRPAV